MTETLGRYRLIRRVAQGGMAEVFVGRSEGAHGFKKTVAVKRILPRYSGDQQFINMMVDEAKISVLLNHPNIAQIYEFGEQDGDYFMVMEYVPGQSMSKLVKRMLKQGKRLDALEASYMVVEMLQGLHAAHVQRDSQGRGARIVHRDVSPQNVLVTYDGHVKLIDFGIAKAKDRLERTEVGTIKGKLRYLAPEMVDPRRFADGVDFDHRVDIFAAGIVLYESISGRMLFSGETEDDVYRAITDDEVPDLALEGDCDTALMTILLKALARPATERYLTAEAFADDLRAYVYRTDPSFTRRRIADHMQRVFATEYVEESTLDVDGDGDVGDAPREVTFIAQPSSKSEATRMGRRGSGRRPMGAPPSGSTGIRLVAAPSQNPSLDDQLPRVSPSALTQVVDAAHLRALETVAMGGVVDDLTMPSGPMASLAEGAPAPTFAPALTPQRRTSSSSGAVVVAPSAPVAPAVDDETGLTPATSRMRPPQVSATKWGGVIALASVMGILMALGVVYVVNQDEAMDRSTSTTDVTAGKIPLIVDATPRDAKVEWLGTPSSPTDVPALFFVTPGESVVLRFTAPHHARLERTVNVDGSDEKPRIEVALDPEMVSLVVKTSPPGATVSVNGAPFSAGMKVTPGKPIDVVAEKDGHADASETVRAVPGESLVVNLTLVPDKVEDKVSPRPTGKRPTQDRPKATKRGKPGILVVTSMPYWGRVTIDGRQLEETTPVRATLPPGSHEVIVEHPPQGLVKRFSVDIESGKTLKRTVKFE